MLVLTQLLVHSMQLCQSGQDGPWKVCFPYIPNQNAKINMLEEQCVDSFRRHIFYFTPANIQEWYWSGTTAKTIFTNYPAATPKLRRVLTMTTASVLNHEKRLLANLPADHPAPSLLMAWYTSDFHMSFSEMAECHIWSPGDRWK